MYLCKKDNKIKQLIMNRVKEALILAIGLVLMGVSIKWGIDGFTNKDRKVTVKGLAEREVPADKVTWTISTNEMGNDLPSLHEGINQTTGKIKQFLKQYGLTEGEISVNPPSVTDLDANQWSENRKGFRYIINSTVTVTSKKVADVRKAIFKQAELLKQGVAIESSSANYEYVSFQKMKPEMMEEAIKNAQKTAEQFAENSDSKLGKIQTAGQGQFEIDDRDASTPHVKKLRVVTTVTYSLKD